MDIDTHINLGIHVKGILSSADASACVEIPLFLEAEGTGAQPASKTLESDEYLVVESLTLVMTDGGDAVIFFDNDDDNALDSGEEIIRGNFAANGGIIRNWPMPFGRRGQEGGKPHIIADAGVVRVELNGFVRRSISRSGPV